MRGLVLLALGVGGGAARAQLIELADPFPHLTFSNPVDFQTPGDGSALLYVAEKSGRVRVFENDPATTAAPTFLDIRSRVSTSGEQGLLGMAFDPAYATNGFVYLNYSVAEPRRQRVSRFVATSPTEGDPNSEVVLYEGDPALPGFTNHNAGAIAFGPPEGPSGERYLYITMGDGGSGNDPQNHGQNLGTLLGGIVRLDVHGGGLPLDCAETGVATVPADNPFVDGPGGNCDELYAYGFRNPWRMTLDEPTGEIWIGDVGQSAWEEVDILERGGNFGWRPYEGTHCILGPCNPDGKVFPVWEYGHTAGHCSITGGYVYRGAAIPELHGWYVYGDWCSGSIWAFHPDDPAGTNGLVEAVAPFGLTTFGTDAAGELYVLAEGGRIRRFVRTPPVADEGRPETAPPGLLVTGPNPVGHRLSLRVRAEGPARVTVYDARGRLVAVLFEGRLRAATSETLDFDVRGLPAGVYLVRLDAGRLRQTVPVTVLR